MKKFAALFLLAILTFTSLGGLAPSVFAGTTGVSWGSVPSQVTVGKKATYKFTVSGSGSISEGDCIITATFSPLGSQSKAALEGTGTAAGKSVYTEYGSAGMSSIAFSGTITLPATFTMSLKNSSEVKPSSTGKVKVTYQMSCDSVLSSTKTVNIVGACYGKSCGCGSLPACKPKATATPKPTATSTPTPTVSVAATTYTFMANGVEVTKLTDLSADKRTNIENFTIESKGKNKVVFSNKVSLLDTVKLQQFDTYVALNETGTVGIDSEKFPELNGPAVITMSGLTFATTPKILRDGKDAGDYVKNVSYNPTTGILTFEVTGFSTYTAREQIVTEDGNQFQLVSYMPYVIIGIVVILGAFVAKEYISRTRAQKAAK